VPLTARERAAFARVAQTALAPAPPLPPVNRTDAAAAFARMLDASPRTHRLALRAAVLATGRMPGTWRREVLRRLDPIRAAVALSYYGDPGVQRVLGYDP
jgi:hypothetical protein